MNSNSPLISCICITGDKPLELQRAVACFIKQDYPNTELIISYPKNDLPSINILNRLVENSIIKMSRLERPRDETTVSARNAAIEIAHGEFICMWHEDHWHHANRISDQYRVIKNSPFRSSVISEILLFDLKKRMTYASKFRCWPETICCDKQIMLKACYINEETTWRQIIQFLFSQNVLYQINNSPHLYIYIFDHLWKNRTIPCSRYAKGEGLTDINEIVLDIIQLDQYLLDNR
ncbi:glycosyltransferase family A protein [Pedobacter gandavensis]|uniref:glycosyltransferase family A protein n=1 Tax=Pedobacter gandavensis TaxID=2679963 RepID=UPI00292CE3B6|nr:glycosyltransferase family A protein [Pedobacter gandavensis]